MHAGGYRTRCWDRQVRCCRGWSVPIAILVNKTVELRHSQKTLDIRKWTPNMGSWHGPRVAVPDFIQNMKLLDEPRLALFDADGTLWENDIADDTTIWMIGTGQCRRPTLRSAWLPWPCPRMPFGRLAPCSGCRWARAARPCSGTSRRPRALVRQVSQADTPLRQPCLRTVPAIALLLLFWGKRCGSSTLA